MSTIGIPTRLRYDHYLDLMPYGWNIASSQACTKSPDQVRDKNHPSLLQEGQEYVIHSWTFVYGAKECAHSTLL